MDNIDAMLELLSWSLATHTHDTFTYLLLPEVPSINTYRTWDRIQWIPVHNYLWKRNEYCRVYDCLPVCRRTSSLHKWKIEWMKSSGSTNYTSGENGLYFKLSQIRKKLLNRSNFVHIVHTSVLVRAIKFSVTTHHGHGEILESLPFASQEVSAVKYFVILKEKSAAIVMYAHVFAVEVQNSAQSATVKMGQFSVIRLGAEPIGIKFFPSYYAVTVLHRIQTNPLYTWRNKAYRPYMPYSAVACRTEAPNSQISNLF